MAPVRFVARASRGSPSIHVNICPKRIRNDWQKIVVSIPQAEQEVVEEQFRLPLKTVVSIPSEPPLAMLEKFRLPLKIVVSIPDVYLNICFSFDFAGYGATILLSNPDQRLANVGF